MKYNISVSQAWHCSNSGTIQWTISQGYAVEHMGVYSTTLERVGGYDAAVTAQCRVLPQTATLHKDFRKSFPVVHWSHMEDGRKSIGVFIMDDHVWMIYIIQRCSYKR